MTQSISLVARIELPIADLIAAVRPEIHARANARPSIRTRTERQAEARAVDQVIAAYERLERVTNTVGESEARRNLMNAISGLRTVRIKSRSK